MKVHVSVPATTANLGPGFDALGLALDLWNETDFSLREDGLVQLSVYGEGMDVLPLDAGNMVARAALQLFELAGKPCPGLQIDCLNRVPLGSGMGSSSAALLTGLLGANDLLGSPMSDEVILDLAIETEGHPDNVAPAMLGGLVVSMVKEDRAFSVRLPAEDDYEHLFVTIALPDFYFPTDQARAILPESGLLGGRGLQYQPSDFGDRGTAHRESGSAGESDERQLAPALPDDANSRLDRSAGGGQSVRSGCSCPFGSRAEFDRLYIGGGSGDRGGNEASLRVCRTGCPYLRAEGQSDRGQGDSSLEG